MLFKKSPLGACCLFFGLAFLPVSAVLSAGINADKSTKNSRTGAVFTKESLMGARAKKDERVSVFVELKAAPLAAFTMAHKKKHGRPATGAQQKQYAQRLKAEQQAFMAYLDTLNAQHVSSLRVSANGIKCRVLKSQIEQIKQHDAVKNVSRVQSRAKPKALNMPRLLSGVGTITDLGLSGKGITMAIVGTGINYELEAFGGQYSFADAGKVINDPNIIEPGTFPTQKIIAGIDLAGSTYNTAADDSGIPQEDADPYEPFFNHETLVAAIAAGMPVEGRVAAGVAPDTKLVAIKIFGDNGQSTELAADAIEYALDPNRDGNMDDKVDIINLSLGSAFGRHDDVDTIAANNAVALGVVVIASVGNEGNNPFISSSPSVSDVSISVGSHASATQREDDNPFTPSSLVFHLGVTINGETVYFPTRALSRFGSRLEQAFSANVVLANPIDTCEPLTQDVAGKIVVFRYANCPGFGNEQNALAGDAGAAASIQIENDDNRLGIAIGDIPAYRLYRSHGEQLLNALKKDAALEVVVDSTNIRLNTAQDFKVSDFSSRGPSYGAGSFKPDLVGPGEDMVAGDAPFPQSGTSFAAPFVAGVAAALLEKNPQFTPADVKAALQNGTAPTRTLNTPNAPFYPLSLQGVGRVQVDKTLALTSLASPGGLSFGVINPSQKHFETRTLTLKNLTNKRRYFDVSVQAGQFNPGVKIRAPREVHLPPHAEKDITIRLVADPKKLTADNANSLIEADGWIILQDQYDTLRVGYAAAVESAANIDIVASDTQSIELSNTGVIGSALEAFSYVQFIDDEEVVEEASAEYPSDAGYRIKKRDDGNVELNMAFIFDKKIPTLMDKERFIDFYIPVDNDEYRLLSVAISRSNFLAGGEPFVHQAVLDVRSDESNFYIDGNVDFDFYNNWLKLTLILADRGETVLAGNPLFAFYFEPNGGLFRTGLDAFDQIIIAPQKAVLPKKSQLTLQVLQPSQSEGGFLIVNKNAYPSQIIDLP